MELAVVLPLVESATDAESPGGMRLLAGETRGRHVLALCAGVGKVAAAAGVRFMLDRYPLPSLLIYGIGGALSPEIRLGDLVIATELVPGDVGVAHSIGFSITGPGICEKGRLVFCPSFPVTQSMLEGAREAAVASGLTFHSGKVLTCDQIVLDPELRAHLRDCFGVLAVEMEGAAAAQIAAGEGLPFIAVRAISDELSHDLVGLEDLLEYKGQSRLNIWHKRFRLTVTDPDALARARGFARGRDIALASLAAFLRSYLVGADEI